MEKKGKTKIMDWKTRKTKGQREKGNHRCRGKKEMWKERHKNTGRKYS